MALSRRKRINPANAREIRPAREIFDPTSHDAGATKIITRCITKNTPKEGKKFRIRIMVNSLGVIVADIK